jgi:hypothetical protein
MCIHDGTVSVAFMTEDPSEADEVHQQMLAFESVAEVRVTDEPDWVSL